MGLREARVDLRNLRKLLVFEGSAVRGMENVRQGRMSATISESPSPPSIASSFGTWTAGVPYPLLFVAGAAMGVLLASLIVLATHARRAPSAANVMMSPPVAVVPAAPPTWQPNVITIRPAAPDPMFDTPVMIEPPALSPPPRPRVADRPAKKAVTRNNVRRRPAGKRVATGNLLTAAL